MIIGVCHKHGINIDDCYECSKATWPTARNNHGKSCRHKDCNECSGTGRKKDGSICVHMISCPCSKCNPASLMAR